MTTLKRESHASRGEHRTRSRHAVPSVSLKLREVSGRSHFEAPIRPSPLLRPDTDCTSFAPTKVSEAKFGQASCKLLMSIAEDSPVTVR